LNLRIKWIGKNSVSHICLRCMEIFILAIVFSPLMELIPGDRTISFGPLTAEIQNNQTMIMAFFSKLIYTFNLLVILLNIRKIIKNLYLSKSLDDFIKLKNYKMIMTIGFCLIIYSFIYPIFSYLAADEIYNEMISLGMSISLDYHPDNTILFSGILFIINAFFIRVLEKHKRI